MTDPLDGVINYLRSLRSDRRLLNLIYASVQRLEIAVSAQTDYMTAALAGLDTQMANLQTRLADEAQQLTDALANATLGTEDEAALNAAAARVQATAELVATLAQPSVVVDPSNPVTPDPITPDPTPDPVTPDPTPAPVDPTA